MRGLLSAYLAFFVPGGFQAVAGDGFARVQSGKTTAKTTTKTV